MADHSNQLNVPHGTFAEYMKGTVLSVIFTLISFGVVMTGSFDKSTAITILAISGFSQLWAQLVYFLHIKNTPDGTWSIATGVFTVIQVLILVLGTAWIMWHLYMNMEIGF